MTAARSTTAALQLIARHGVSKGGDDHRRDHVSHVRQEVAEAAAENICAPAAVARARAMKTTSMAYSAAVAPYSSWSRRLIGLGQRTDRWTFVMLRSARCGPVDHRAVTAPAPCGAY